MSRRFTVTALPRHGPPAARGPDRGAGGGRLPGRDGRGERPGTAGGAGAGGGGDTGRGHDTAWGRASGAGSAGRGLWGRAGGAGSAGQGRVRGGGGAGFPGQGPRGGSPAQGRAAGARQGGAGSARAGDRWARPLGGGGDPRSGAAAGLRDAGAGGCRAGSGARPPGQDPSSQGSAPGLPPLLVPIRGVCRSEAPPLRDRQRDGARITAGTRRDGCGVRGCRPLLGELRRRLGCRAAAGPARGHGEGKRQPALGGGSPLGTGGCGRWVWQAVALRCPGDVVAGLWCHRSCIDPRNPADSSTALRGAVTLHPRRRALVGGSEQLDGCCDTQAGLCPCQWAPAPGLSCPASLPQWGGAGLDLVVGGCRATCHPTVSRGGWAWPMGCIRGRADSAEPQHAALSEGLIGSAADLLAGGRVRSRPGRGGAGGSMLQGPRQGRCGDGGRPSLAEL